MPHKLLERKYIVNKTTYHPRYLITTVLSDVEEIIEFSNITNTSYTQHQAVNIAYCIIHRTVKFGLLISKWNFMPTVQKTWVGFKQFFQKMHR